MSRAVLLLFASFLCLSAPVLSQTHCTNSRDFTNKDRIVGGRLALIDNWPGQAILRLREDDEPSYICGGTLISPTNILTAAHCVQGLSENDGHWADAHGRIAEVVIGTDDLRNVSATNVHEIAKIVIHERYLPTNHKHDIALITLRQRSNSSTAYLSPSARADPSFAWVTPVMVAGFGAQSDGEDLKEWLCLSSA